MIDQAAIEEAADALFPSHSPATRNREVFTPVSAILKHAGREFKIKRPKGSRGLVVTRWLWPEQAFRIFAAAQEINVEFAILLQVLCYCGPRLSEALSIRCDDVRLAESFAYIGHTKNGDPRPIFLPPTLVAMLANHPRGLNRPGERVFRFHQDGALSYLLEAACMITSALPKPVRVKKGKKNPHGHPTSLTGSISTRSATPTRPGCAAMAGWTPKTSWIRVAGGARNLLRDTRMQ